uniref:Uncharacterized protein n=1 Tax=Setaria italica TaxID=4555 RepID=K3XUL7_SETIT
MATFVLSASQECLEIGGCSCSLRVMWSLAGQDTCFSTF